MSAPTFPRLVSVAEVVENARCELYDAVRENNKPWVKQWAAGFEFSFVVDRDANASTDTSYLVPIDLGTSTIGLKANLKQKAKSTYVVKYRITKGLEKFDAMDGSGRVMTCAERLAEQPRRLLNGEIGLRRWINEVVPQIEQARIMNDFEDEPKLRKKERALTGELESLSYTIEFGVTIDGSLVPSWALAYLDKRQFKPAFNLTASEIVTHKLIVAMIPRVVPIPSPLDWTAVLGTRKIDGKDVKVILGRRICEMGADTAQRCLGELHEGERKAEQRVGEAQRNLESIKTQQKDTANLEKDEVLKDLQAKVPPQYRSIPPSEILKYNKEKLTTMGDEGGRRRSAPSDLSVAVEKARKQIDQIDKGNKRAVNAAEEEVRRAKEQLRDVRKAPDLELRAAKERAEAEAERETARRLDYMIQQQVIRDSFRQ